jgi:hypothetical protein
LSRKIRSAPMGFTRNDEQAETLVRRSEGLRIPTSAVVRDAVTARLERHQRELAEEEASERGRSEVQGRGHR